MRVQELYNALMAQRMEGQKRDAEARARGSSGGGGGGTVVKQEAM
jgi:hypothetical protein